jgi:hypothetical protein
MKKVFIILLILVSPAIQSAQWEEALRSLSSSERFYLKNFLKYSVQDSQFGFTLFFDKPVSLGGYCVRWRSDEMIHPYRNKLIKRGWNVWKKHESSFPHPNFIFCEEHEEFYDLTLRNTFKVCRIYLINKLAFLKLLQEQMDIFVAYLARISHTFSDSSHTLHDDLASQVGEAVLHEHCPRPLERQSQSAERRSVQKKCEKSGLGTNFSPDTLLADIESTQTLMPHINQNRVLLGICLGYGLESALQFERHGDESIPFEDAFYQPISSYQPAGCPIIPVVFAGNPDSPQVQNIQQHYAEPIIHIWRIYQDPTFLHIVLNRLCSPEKGDH